MGYKLFNRETNQLIGSITDQDFKFLEDALEEESIDDNDYYIDLSTILLLENAGASHYLLSTLKAAVSEDSEEEASEGIDVRWEKV